MSKAKQYLAGVRISLPVIFGYLPVAIAFAVMAAEAGFSRLEMIMMSTLVFAGGSQIMAIGMVSAGASMLSIVVGTLVFNLRHFIMGSYIMRKLRKAKLVQRLISSHGITDESFAIIGATPESECTMPYFFGIITVTYGSWILGTAIGAFVSILIPPVVSDALGIALYALFISLLVPSIKGSVRLVLLVVMTAVINCALTAILPESASSWAIIISCLIGALIGVFFVDDKEVA